MAFSLDNLSKRRQEYFPDDEPQEEDLHKELMDRIAAEIDSCGNSIDTYYKECKLGEQVKNLTFNFILISWASEILQIR